LTSEEKKVSAPTFNSPLFSYANAHQAFEVTNEHARACLDPAVLRVDVLLGPSAAILVILRRVPASKEERVAKWFNEGGFN
jgi:hypothetical protein